MTTRADRRHASRVAAFATLLGMSCFVVSVFVLDLVLVGHATAQVTGRLAQELQSVKRVDESSGGSIGAIAPEPADQDDDDAPVFLWRVGSSGVATAVTSATPPLGRHRWTVGLTTISVNHSTFELDAARLEDQWLVAGESLADVQRLRTSLWTVESIAGAILMILMFSAAYVVGVRALAPVAQARRRQAEFTADASHELRTPLSVLEAEVEIALSRDRDVADYQATLRRIGQEGRRLHHLVEDLLWLARSDESRRESSTPGPTDLCAIASAGCQRFAARGAAGGQTVRFELVGSEPATVRAAADDLDRLVSVLVDNACKFAGDAGQVVVRVTTTPSRVSLVVDDSGPGIALNERARIFDRFHHTDAPSGGTGLGLAIADSIIRRTHAHCVVATADLGGARFEITWRREP